MTAGLSLKVKTDSSCVKIAESILKAQEAAVRTLDTLQTFLDLFKLHVKPVFLKLIKAELTSLCETFRVQQTSALVRRCVPQFIQFPFNNFVYVSPAFTTQDPVSVGTGGCVPH